MVFVIYIGNELKLGVISVPMSHAYTLKEIANFQGIHFTTISKVITKGGVGKK